MYVYLYTQSVFFSHNQYTQQIVQNQCSAPHLWTTQTESINYRTSRTNTHSLTHTHSHTYIYVYYFERCHKSIMNPNALCVYRLTKENLDEIECDLCGIKTELEKLN